MTCSLLTFGPVSIAGGLAASLLSACVAKDSDTLGELDDASTSAATEATGPGSDDGNDDGVTSSASDGADAGDDAATTGMTGGTSGTSGTDGTDGTDDGDVFDAVCEAIVGTTFESIEELECGLTPEGVELCHWQVRFEDNGEWLWNYSDVGQGGDYTCVGGVLTITNDVTIEHAYDPRTQTLTWEGVDYRPAAG